MGIIDVIIHIIFHPDQAIASVAQSLGNWLYLILFLILFAETGLVITPFLPGDSLLFALGAMTTLSEGGLSFEVLSVLLMLAVFIGDNVNYHFGRYLGPQVFNKKGRQFFNPESLAKAHFFYTKHGALAVVLARFIPIVRTFVPFVAGLGQMSYKKFIFYSVFGAVLWIQIFLWAGRLFGNIPSVKTNFHLVIFGVILLSVAPLLIGFLRAKLNAPKNA